MSRILTVLRAECLNALRSKWLYAFACLLMVTTIGLNFLSEDQRKTELALINILVLTVPLVSVLFSTAYWYQEEPFTELLLAQPLSRRLLFWSRAFALILALCVALFVGFLAPALLMGLRDSGLLLLSAGSVFLVAIFYFIGALIVSCVSDRMWGLGLALGAWCYLSVIHDGAALLLLYWFREYPMEKWSAVLCALNPLGLLRVTLLMHFDAPLLLGHSGAFIRHLMEDGVGQLSAYLVMIVWVALPAFLAGRSFQRADY